MGRWPRAVRAWDGRRHETRVYGGFGVVGELPTTPRARTPIRSADEPASPWAPWSPRSSAVAALTAVALLAAPAAASAFDTGPHSDITRDALTAEGFGATAADVVVVNNWFVDLYSNSSKIPQSGHADTAVSVLGAFFENDENWPQAVLDGADRMHFDSSIWDVANVGKAQQEWDRLQRSTTQLLRSIKSVNGPNKEIQVLSTIGMGLHSLQDFYSHSNWIEQQGVDGRRRPRLVGAAVRAHADVVRRPEGRARQAQRLHRRVDRAQGPAARRLEHRRQPVA